MPNQYELLEKLFDAKLEPLSKGIQEVKADVQGFNEVINGNPKLGRTGLIARVERIEQKVGWAIAAASFVFVFSFEIAKDFIKGKIKI